MSQGPQALLAVSGVIDKGNIVVFDGSGSFILPNWCAGVASVGKAITGVQGRIPLHAKNGVLVLTDVGTLRLGRRRISDGGEPLERAEYQAEQAWTTRKTVERSRIGYIW